MKKIRYKEREGMVSQKANNGERPKNALDIEGTDLKAMLIS